METRSSCGSQCCGTTRTKVHKNSDNPVITVRRATVDDAALVTELGTRTFVETFAAENSAEDMAAYLTDAFSPAQQAAELGDSASMFFIAEVDGSAAGYAQVRKGEPDSSVKGMKPIELVRLYVSQEWLGRGVGNELMRACIEEARYTGHKTIWLGVWERNARAQAFYRKWDFVPVGHHVFQLGSDAQTDILMERLLTQ